MLLWRFSLSSLCKPVKFLLLFSWFSMWNFLKRSSVTSKCFYISKVMNSFFSINMKDLTIFSIWVIVKKRFVLALQFFGFMVEIVPSIVRILIFYASPMIAWLRVFGGIMKAFKTVIRVFGGITKVFKNYDKGFRKQRMMEVKKKKMASGMTIFFDKKKQGWNFLNFFKIGNFFFGETWKGIRNSF